MQSSSAGPHAANQPQSSAHGIQSLLPVELHGVFDFSHLNRMQATLFQQVFHTNKNMIVAAPTGSGKTVVMELAILRLYQAKRHSLRSLKVVYIAPNKALCQQRCTDWNNKFQSLGLSILEVTGDIDLKDSLRTIARANVIITTPEKWDSLTRSWRDHVFLMGAINLLLIDEIHHLGEDRGPVLEIVVVRMRIISQTCIEKSSNDSNTSTEDPSRMLRIIGLSATLPNLAEIGEWLQCSPDAVHFFDESFRPIPLQAITLVCGSMGNPFLFDRSLDNQVKDVVLRHSEGKQTLIFCSSKSNAQNLAIKLRSQSTLRTAAVSNPEVMRIINEIQDDTLRSLVVHGYGYHHAGLPPDDRAVLEELFLKGYVRILCSTSTLAHGVNLPAHLVIIKGTYCWRGSARGYEKLSKSDVIQMLGRAGRPGFDEHGVAVIMTSSEDRQYYSNLSLSADLVESKLLSILPEAITAEISQTVIRSVADAIRWIKSTFYYIRAKKAYLASHPGAHQEGLDASLSETCEKVITELHNASIIWYDVSSGDIQANPEAVIMARHLTKFLSMQKLMSLKGMMELQRIIHALSFCEELHRPLRRLEKKQLNEWMSSIRYPSKERVQQPSHKAYILLLAAVSRLQMKDFTLRIEQAEMVENAMRLLRCLQELSIERCEGSVLEASVLFERALRTRLWEVNSNIFLQCAGITENTLRALAQQRLTTPGHLEGSSANQLVHSLDCSQSEARALLYFSQELNCARLVASCSVKTSQLLLSVRRADFERTRSLPLDTQSSITHQLICYDTLDGELLCHRRISLPMSQEEVLFSVTLPADKANDNSLSERLKLAVYGNIVGVDYVQEPTVPPSNAKVEGTKKIAIRSKQTKKSLAVPIEDQRKENTSTATQAPKDISPSPARNKPFARNPFEMFKLSKSDLSPALSSARSISSSVDASALSDSSGSVSKNVLKSSSQISRSVSSDIKARVRASASKASSAPSSFFVDWSESEDDDSVAPALRPDIAVVTPTESLNNLFHRQEDEKKSETQKPSLFTENDFAFAFL